MKKLFLLVSLFITIAYQLAHARDYYGYEHVEYGAPEYVEIDGVRYTRVPQKVVPNFETPRYELQHEAESRYGLRPVDEPRYAHRRVIKPQRYYATARYDDEPSRLKISWDVKPYIGFDLGTTDFSFDKSYKDEEVDVNEVFGTKPKFWGVVAGLKFNPYVGVEAFYQKSSGDTKSFAGGLTEFSAYTLKTAMNFEAYGADLLGYLPLNDNLEMVLGLGLAKYEFKGSIKGHIISPLWSDADGKVKISSDGDSMAGRFGLGVQYGINEHLALRAMARYVKFFDDDDFEKMIELSLGLRYFF